MGGEVVMEERTVSLGVVVEAGVLGLTGLLVSLAFFLFNLRLRSNRLIKMSSPVLNLFTAGGGILLSVCSTLYGLDYFLRDLTTTVSSAMCRGRVVLLVCGSSLLFGPMFFKAWRVYRLFHNAGKRRVIIRDSRLLVMTGVVVMVDVALLLVWHATDPLLFRPMAIVRQLIQMESWEAGWNSSTPLQVTQIYACTSPSSPPFLAAFLLLKMALLCYGLFLSWQTRAVALPSMNDSRCIVVSALTTVTMATVTLAVSHVLPEHPNAVHACVVLSIWLCTVVTLCMAFIPKVSLWWRNPEAKGLRVSVTSSTGSSSSPLFPLQHLEEEIGQVVGENQALRKSLEEKDSSIRQLQQHLTNAYKHLSHLGMNLDSGLDADLSSSDSSQNPVDFSKQTAINPSTSRNPNLVDQHNAPFCGGNISRNDHPCLQVIKEGNSSIKHGKGGSSSSVKFDSGDVPPSPDSGEFDLSLGDTNICGLGSAAKKRINSSQSSSDQTSNTDGDSPVFVPSIHSRKIPKQLSQSSSLTAYRSGQHVPRLHLDKLLPRQDSKPDYFVFPTAQTVCSSSPDPHTNNVEARSHTASSRRSSAFSETARALSTHGIGRRKRSHSCRRHHSANSVTSADKLSELRAAIALDLQRARSLSNVLSNSVTKELDNMYRRHSRRLRGRSSSIKSREDLAESIVGSYGLEDNRDTLSYVSSFLPVPCLHDTNHDPLTSRTELSVLDNDALYPERRHNDSKTSTHGHRKKWSDSSRDSGCSLDRNINSRDHRQGSELSCQRTLSQTDRYERYTKFPARQSRKKGQRFSGSVQNLNSNGRGYDVTAASLNRGDNGSRSEPALQEPRGDELEVFSVYAAQPASFVQKSFAQTRALYSADIFI